MPLQLEIVTAERMVFHDDNVDMVIAPSVDGQVGILPRHAPLLTVLQVGELRVQKGNDEQSIVIAGGFMEVLNNKVTILADAAERSRSVLGHDSLRRILDYEEIVRAREVHDRVHVARHARVMHRHNRHRAR